MSQGLQSSKKTTVTSGSPQTPFWAESRESLVAQVRSSPGGLTAEDAAERLVRYGRNTLRAPRRTDTLALLLRQFKSPIVLILIFAAILSAFLKDRVDAGIILGIVLVSSLLGFWQERGATNAVKKLLAIVEVKATALRDGQAVDVPVEEIVPGDMVLLNAGDVIPGDCLVLESKELFVDEAALTGESYPVEKQPGVLPRDTPLAKRSNSLFMGTHVVSGTSSALVVHTAKDTEFGQISERLRLRATETEFEHGVRRFGYFLAEVTMILVLLIFGFNVYLHRPVLDSFLFSLALAVGLTPQLLPAIISINLARGAKRMAEKKVIVKRLAAIENLGSMNILCSDKTGTLTEGEVKLHAALDANSHESERVLFLGYLNAFYETGFHNPIDAAIRSYRELDVSGYAKADEVPYDFARKRLSVLVQQGATHLMVTKGPLISMLDVCTQAEIPSSKEGDSAPGSAGSNGMRTVDMAAARAQIEARYAALSGQGYRVLGVAYRDVGDTKVISPADETNMVFAGFLVFFDPPKEDIAETLRQLRDLGVQVKVITGDNPLVAANVAAHVGLPEARVVSAKDLGGLSDEALRSRAGSIDVFAEIEPNQKERIILALRKAGNVVGYMGDGINDASALHAADVSISVNTAADVAQEAADFVLLEKDLAVVGQGVREGRRTFANTLKYVFMATSANFGNMFSMAGASLFLSFLPLLPKQVLLTNLMTDFPEMTIASDNVDPEMVGRPRRWDIRFIRRFMLVFGLLSSVFDYATFGLLLLVFHVNAAQFRTGWFVESVISAALVVLVIRTRRPIFRSRPSWKLLTATLLVVAAVVVMPLTPVAGPLGFVRIPLSLYAAIVGIIAAYVAGAEGAKRLFYRRGTGRRDSHASTTSEATFSPGKP